MTDLEPREWLDVIRRDYLDDFVREGGAAVKFIVPPSAAGRREVVDGLREIAEQARYQFALVDAATTKIHLIDRLFHAVAGQVDWDALTRTFLIAALREEGFTLPGDPAELRLADIARLNDRPSEALVRNQVRTLLENRVYRDYEMSQEFRLAMIRLCLAVLDPDDEPGLEEAVKAWLRGELRLISTLKRALIFQKIARHNGRHMLFSLAHWLKLAGRSGLLLVLDISRYGDTARLPQRQEGLYYSTAATLDAYEVLRQLIDATDELTFCFVGVVAAPEFLTDDRRGVRRYDALYLRVADEVRDRVRANPLSSLVRVGTGE